MITENMRAQLAQFMLHPEPYLVRVHGNGFIQISLMDPTCRIHIWHNSLPHQKVDTQVHDHRFSFHSTVLHGRMVHTPFEIVHDGDCPIDLIGHYRIYTPQVREGEDTILARQAIPMHDVTFTLRAPNSLSIFGEGDTYSFEAGRFHSSRVEGLTITLMEKTEVFEDMAPRVMVPATEEPDNDFNRYHHLDNPAVQDVYLEALEIMKVKPMWSWSDIKRMGAL